MDNATIEAQIRFARAYAAEQLPWFAPALFRTKIRLTPHVNIAGIDEHYNIYFNPEKIKKILGSNDKLNALAQIGFLWVHEISHVLREHGNRAKELKADPELWNIATDLEINDSLWEGLEMPKLYPGLLPHHYKMLPGQLAETYYKKLTEKSDPELEKGFKDKLDEMEKAEETEREEQEKGDDNEEKEEDNAQDKSSDEDDIEEEESDKETNEGEGDTDKENWDENSEKEDRGVSKKEEEKNTDDKGNADTDPIDNHQEANDDKNPSTSEENSDSESSTSEDTSIEEASKLERFGKKLDEGSGVHGQKRSWEVDMPEDKNQELDEIEKEQVKIAVAQEMNEAKKAGKLPGSWARWVGDVLEPKVDWRKVLRHRISRAIDVSVGAKLDYSFKRPSRRQAVYQPLIPPSLGGDISGQITCVVDTSASISDAVLQEVMGEIFGIMNAFNRPITMIPCDAKAYDAITIQNKKALKNLDKIQGGGGTNMIRGIEKALSLKPSPDVIIVLTDGYTPYPKKLYKTPVLFALLVKNLNNNSMLPKAPWRKDHWLKILI